MTDYDSWLTKPYDDLYDAETTVCINCAELHDTEENWECDYEGDADACITEKSSGRYGWSATYEGECPKCSAPFRKYESEEFYPDDY